MTRPALFAGRRARLAGRILLVGLAQAAVTVALALLLRHSFQALSAAPGAGLGSTQLAGVSAVIALIAAAAYLRMQERVSAERLGQHYVRSLRKVLYDQLQGLDPRTRQARPGGTFFVRFVGDLGAVRQWISLGLARLAVAGISTGISLAALATLNVAVAMAAGCLLLAGSAASLFTGRLLGGAARESRRRTAHLANNIGEKIAAMEVVQLFGQGRRERRRVLRQSRRLATAMIRRARLAGLLRGISEATGALALAGTLLVGLNEFAHGRADTGTVVAAMTIVGLLAPAMRSLGRALEYWHGYQVAVEKIDGFLGLPRRLAAAGRGIALPPGPPDIRIENVSLGDALHDFSGRVEPGQTVAIVGPNGAGKSTLLSLLCRQSAPSSGRITIGGQDLAATALSSIRAAIGVVSPDLPLLRGTVRSNILYRRPDASERELRRVCRLCGIDRLAEELPAGLETRVHEKGSNLSLGQRHRIALARALVGRPQILLLDEADNSLDFQAGKIIDRILQGFDGTVLMVTHRLERLASCDELWHIAGGRLVEHGPATAVLRGNGPTAALFGRQLRAVS